MIIASIAVVAIAVLFAVVYGFALGMGTAEIVVITLVLGALAGAYSFYSFVTGVAGMLHLFVLDGLFLYLVLFGAAACTLWTIEYEKPGLCTTVILLTLGLLESFSDLHPIGFALRNPVQAMTLVAVYFALGTGWIVLKWYSHTRMVGDEFALIKDDIQNDVIRQGMQFTDNTAVAGPVLNDTVSGKFTR